MEQKTEQDWLNTFSEFIKYLKIDSRELQSEDDKGAHFELWDSQRLFLEELASGLAQGVRIFDCLKARQLGVTTISLAIDIFWMAMHPATIGCVVADTDTNREVFRSVLRRYINSFPKGFFGKSFGIIKGGDNRNMMRFSNGSRLDFLVAGTRKNITWGEGKGYTHGHITEFSKYGDSRGLDSFKESMALTHPNRLFIFESTGNGYNHRKDMWDEAGRDKYNKRRIFLGWWSRNINRIERNDQRWDEYGSHYLSEDEKEKVALVKEKYNYNVSLEQIAWYRERTSDESVDMASVNQNLPWDDEECFVQSGSSFFPMRTLNQDIKIILANPPGFWGFKYWLGNDFVSGRMEEITEQDRVDEVDLRVWEKPVDGAFYVIGCDAALGRSDYADRNTIEVYRCYADKLVQVAEYCSSIDDTRQAAWVLAYLAGTYKNCRVNIDVTGGYGTAIMNELESLKQRMRSEMYAKMTASPNSWDDFLSNASWYMYHRPDSPGVGFAYGTVWGSKVKYWGCNSFRDSYCSGMLIVQSLEMLKEMSTVVRDGLDVGSSIASKGKQKDDRVFASILAEMAWKSGIRPMLINENYSYDLVTSKETNGQNTGMNAMVEGIVNNFFAQALKLGDEPPDDRPKWRVERGLA